MQDKRVHFACRLAFKQVVAIDRRKDELEKAPDGPLKVVADATALPFLDKTFDHPMMVGEKDVFATELSVELGYETITTGYDALWEGKAMCDSTMLDYAQKVGFELVDQRRSDEQFYLNLKKRITEVS